MATHSLVRRAARVIFGPFPDAKRFVVHRLLPLWDRWMPKGRVSGLGLHLSTSDPEFELRLLKVEGALHLSRIAGTTPAAPMPAANAPRRALLVDVRITQISMRERGIPRYTTALALALPDHLPDTDIAYLIDPEQPPPDALAAFAQRGRIVNGASEIAGLPNVTHYLQCCHFELHKDVRELFPPELGHFRPRLSAIVYDVIPWLFPAQYLADPYLSRRYSYQLSLLPDMDRLFAISECARRDVIEAAHLPAERVTNIYGGIDESRWSLLETRHDDDAPMEIVNEQGERFLVRQPYWLYVGGDDFRKNLRGLVRAFARVLKEFPDRPTRPALVIACSLNARRRNEIAALAQEMGVQPGVDLIITGYVSDATLNRCYRNAFATVFPSLYEGLGLPILESYHFGVPALASGVSSLTEVTAPCCQFDPASEESIAEAMVRMHRDPALRVESLAFGRQIMAECNWQSAAIKVAAWLVPAE